MLSNETSPNHREFDDTTHTPTHACFFQYSSVAMRRCIVLTVSSIFFCCFIYALSSSPGAATSTTLECAVCKHSDTFVIATHTSTFSAHAPNTQNTYNLTSQKFVECLTRANKKKNQSTADKTSHTVTNHSSHGQIKIHS